MEALGQGHIPFKPQLHEKYPQHIYIITEFVLN